VVRYFVIVGQREASLFDYLERRFAGDATVEVVTDRRRSERRREARPRKPDRRDRERRGQTGLVHLPGMVLARQRREPAPVAAESPRKAPMVTEEPPSLEARGPSRLEGPGATRTQLIQQLAEHRAIFELVPQVLDELVAAEQECERLRQALADSLSEQDRLRGERAELAEALSKLMAEMTRPMHELAEKLRLTSRTRD
jgi:hypothetical protein